MGSSLLGIYRVIVYGLWTALMIPVQVAALVFRRPLRVRLPCLYHRACLRLLGFRLDVRGKMSRDRPTLFVANHSSYLDIMILGALIPGSFVAKAEIANWPFFGLLAKLQRTVFVDRRANSLRLQRDNIVCRLEAGDNLILFPEGTSGDGIHTLPFKSALFGVAETTVDGRPVTVQPVSVACTALDGIPLGRRLRSIYAWYGGMDLIPHLWNMVRLGRLTVVVDFHPTVTLEAAGSRKALADHCWREVANGVAAANSGRTGTPRAA